MLGSRNAQCKCAACRLACQPPNHRPQSPHPNPFMQYKTASTNDDSGNIDDMYKVCMATVLQVIAFQFGPCGWIGVLSQQHTEQMRMHCLVSRPRNQQSIGHWARNNHEVSFFAGCMLALWPSRSSKRSQKVECPYFGLDVSNRVFQGTFPHCNPPVLMVSTPQNGPNARVGPRTRLR